MFLVVRCQALSNIDESSIWSRRCHLDCSGLVKTDSVADVLRDINVESICCNIGYASQIVLCRGCLSSSLYIERGSLSYSNGKSLSMMEKNFPSPHSILSFYTRALSIFCNDGISLLFAIHLYNGRKSHTSIDRGTPARNIITLRISNMKLTELPTQPCLSR